MSKSYEQPQPFDNRPLRAVPSAREEDTSIGGLLKQLTREIPLLFTKELALAKAEMRENLRATKAGVAAVATGGAVMLAGLIVLLMAGVYGLSTVLAPWLSALIVGAAALVVGWVMVSAGKKRFEPASLKPDHTLHSLQKDADAIRGRTP
ncbi:MAG TPA: phage holin family protein [Frateuria sp.]|uniref:phage holin family protein n=1 Tax=Frateuria sp. TaxID=2211372 RepID=UPI002D7EE856|nr:phage holin family protein [Frateuria sp.]HET6805688.1 phage holin family protein [Frateuria sp.]